MTQIDYFLFPLSPFTLPRRRPASERIAAARGAQVVYRPVQLFRIFEATGTRQGRRPAPLAAGLPAEGHRPRRGADRPAGEPAGRRSGRPTRRPASAAIITAQAAGGGDLGGLVHGFLAAVWAEDRDISDDVVVRDVLAAHGFDPALADRDLMGAMETLQRNTDEALRRGVFGAPSYVVGEEVFWGAGPPAPPRRLARSPRLMPASDA